MNSKILYALILSSCVATTALATPRKIFEEYHAALVDGMVFDDQMGFYSESKKAEVNDLLEGFQSRSGAPKNQVLFRFSQRSQSLEDCKDLEFTQESTLGTKSVLTYRLLDTCGSENDIERTQTIEMIWQGGWKIVRIDIDIGNP